MARCFFFTAVSWGIRSEPVETDDISHFEHCPHGVTKPKRLRPQEENSEAEAQASQAAMPWIQGGFFTDQLSQIEGEIRLHIPKVRMIFYTIALNWWLVDGLGFATLENPYKALATTCRLESLRADSLPNSLWLESPSFLGEISTEFFKPKCRSRTVFTSWDLGHDFPGFTRPNQVGRDGFPRSSGMTIRMPGMNSDSFWRLGK